MKGLAKLISATILLLVLTTACKRAAEVMPLPDLEAPTIKISSPTNQSIKNSAEPVHIIGTVIDEFGTLSSLTIEVYTADSFKRVQYFTPDVVGLKGYAFREQYLMPLNNGSVVRPFLLAIAATDSAGNRATDSLLFNAY